MADVTILQQLQTALRAYYRQWQALTTAEGEAIVAGHWWQVEQLQESKRQLQQFIEGTTRELRAACAARGLEAQAFLDELKPVVQELIALEAGNGRALAAQRQRVQQRRQQLTATSQNLRQVRDAYAQPRESNWQSYS